MWKVWGKKEVKNVGSVGKERSVKCGKCGEREECRERRVMWAPKSYLTKLSSNKKADQNKRRPP